MKVQRELQLAMSVQRKYISLEHWKMVRWNSTSVHNRSILHGEEGSRNFTVCDKAATFRIVVYGLDVCEPGLGPIYFVDQTPEKSKCHIMHT